MQVPAAIRGWPRSNFDPWWVYACIAGAIALRFGLLLTSLSEISADEAVPGLQSRHIWLLGARPLVDYENPPHGSLEMYLTAAAFALFGSSALTLRIVAMTFGVAFVPLSYLLGRAAFSARVGRWSALYASIGPAFLEIWQLKAGSGYVIVLAFGAAALLVIHGIAYRGWRWPAFGALGLLLGAGFWNHPVMFYFWVVAAIVIGLLAIEGIRAFDVRPGRLIRGIPPAVSFVLGFGAGLGPLIAHNLKNEWVTLQLLTRSDAALPSPVLALRDVFRVAAPIMLGFTQPTSNPDQAAQLVASTVWWNGIGIAVGAMLFAFTLWYGRRAIRSMLRLRLPADAGAPMLLALIVTPILFSLSRFRDFLTEPRYLMPMFVAMPIVVGLILGSNGRIRVAAGRLVMTAALAVNLIGVVRIQSDLNLPWDGPISLAGANSALSEFLTGRQLHAFYGDYWTVYPVMFESREKVLGSAIMNGADIGWNRYLPAAHAVSISENPAVVQIAGTDAEARFRQHLSRRSVTYEQARVGVYSVYWAFSERAFGF